MSSLEHGRQWLAHDGNAARKRRLKQMARAELKELKRKHGVQVGLDGRLESGVIVEPTRAKNFDNGIVDLSEHLTARSS